MLLQNFDCLGSPPRQWRFRLLARVLGHKNAEVIAAQLRKNYRRFDAVVLETLRDVFFGSAQPVQWLRVVMDREMEKLAAEAEPSRLSALEVSGDKWRDFGFKDYTSLKYPEFDLCQTKLDRRFDIVIAEQVLEHVLWPYRAGRAAYELLNPGGYFLLSTPFLVKIHLFPPDCPYDCTRWTETGLRYFLAECGFPLDGIVTGSWGNRSCIKQNFPNWAHYRPRIHSLRNEPGFPVSIWARARKAG